MINNMHTVVNEPHWGILVSLYYFLVAVSTGTMLFIVMAQLFHVTVPSHTARKAAYISLGALATAGPILIGELMQPMRFVTLLNPINFNPASPLAWGGVLLSLFGATLVLFIYQHGGFNRFIPAKFMQETAATAQTGVDLIKLAMLVVGVALALLPALELIVVHAKAFWRSELIPIYFFTTSMLAGCAVYNLINNQATEESAPSNVGIMKLCIALSFAWIIIRTITLKSGGMEELLALKIWWGNSIFLAGELVLGLILPFALLTMAGTQKSNNTYVKVASLLVLVGVFAMRYVIVHVGNTAILP